MGVYYQVVAECVYATTDTVYGRAKTLVYKDGIVPADAPEVKDLLGKGMIVAVGVVGPEAPPVLSSSPTVVDHRRDAGEAMTSAELAEKRAAAAAKLPVDGSAPDGRAAQEVWVEYLVSKGSRYGDVSGADKAELRKLAEQQS